MHPSSETVSLDPQHAAVLERIAQLTGKTYQQLVADAIDLAFPGQERTGARPCTPSEQRENLSALVARMSQLPVRHPQDGLSGRDHDQILYGGSKR